MDLRLMDMDCCHLIRRRVMLRGACVAYSCLVDALATGAETMESLPLLLGACES